MKVCIKCQFNKEESQFSKNKRNKDGIDSMCKQCTSIKNKTLYLKNKESVNKRRKDYYQKNKDKENLKSKLYYENNKSDIIENQKQYNEINKEKIKEYHKEYAKSEKVKIYKTNNKDRLKAYDREYRSRPDVKKRVSKRTTELRRKRSLEDPIYYLTISIRSSISNNFRVNGFKKSNKTEEILGCTFEEFKIYLESKFEPWMNWANKGLYNGEFNFGWDIDHIIPISTSKSLEDVVSLNHYTNLQPLCSKINREIKRESYEMSI
jgi:hypothetical protein